MSDKYSGEAPEHGADLRFPPKVSGNLLEGTDSCRTFQDQVNPGQRTWVVLDAAASKADNGTVSGQGSSP